MCLLSLLQIFDIFYLHFNMHFYTFGGAYLYWHFISYGLKGSVQHIFYFIYFIQDITYSITYKWVW